MAKKTAHALWIIAPGQAELRTETLPELARGELQIRASYSGISRGTESLIFAHAVPEQERERMRAPHQAGSLPAAVKYGYASVGQVVAGSAELHGRHVFCLFPHQNFFCIAADQVLPLPDAVPPARAVLAANMETAVNALWDAGPLLGQRIVVIGAGVVGALCAYLAARIPGCEVTLVDVLPEREALAHTLGAKFALADAAASCSARADLVLHASGQAAGLALALQLAAEETRIIELSWYGDKPVTLPLGAAFHPGRLQIISSQVGKVSPAMRSHRTHRERLALALSLLTDPALDHLISREVRFAELPAALPSILGPGSHVLCTRVAYAHDEQEP